MFDDFDAGDHVPSTRFYPVSVSVSMSFPSTTSTCALRQQQRRAFLRLLQGCAQGAIHGAWQDRVEERPLPEGDALQGVGLGAC